MTAIRGHLTAHHLSGLVRQAFGAARSLRGVHRLRGGTTKGVYRLRLDDGTTAIAYVWRADENYWPQVADRDPSDPFGHATGIDLFESAHHLLRALDVRVPRIVLLDRGQELVGGDVAVVRDIRGGTLRSLRGSDSHRARRVVDRLGHAIRRMHAHQRSWYGRPSSESSGSPSGRPPVERIVLRRALADLVESATRVDRIAAVEQDLAGVLRERFAAVTPRTGFGLIHGELGPDHVLVDDQDEPVLIDIEGTMFCDVEWEHVYLQLRFGEDYPRLAVDGLDRDRLSFYRLALHLSLVAGPLRLLNGDFPDRARMLEIVDHNIDRTLGQLR